LSSILKALKKIEGDSPSPQTFPSLPKPFDPKQTPNSNTRKRRRRRRLIYLFLILLVMAVATIILFSQRRLIIARILSTGPSQSPTASEASNSNRTNVYRAKIPTSSAKPAQKPPTLTQRPKKQTNKTVPGSSDKKFQASTKPSNRRLISGPPPPKTSADDTRPPQAAQNARVKKPLKKAPPPPASAPVKRTVAKKDTRPIAPAARAKQPAQTRPRVTYDRLDDSKLKLQALAWSDDAARRMAVINGRIVHEGESVDGYQVLKIREEDVVVDGGGKSWRLEFGLQQ